MLEFDDTKQKGRLRTFQKQEKENLAKTLAEHYKLEYTNLATVQLNIDALRLLSEEKAREAKAAVFDMIDKKIKVAILSPRNEITLKEIENLKSRGYLPEISVASIDSLELAWAKYKDLSYAFETKAGSLEISNTEISEKIKKIKNKNDVKEEMDLILSSGKGFKISKILEIVLAGAIALKASDIHVEPEEKDIRVRYRLDGVLNNLININYDTYRLFLSRIKLLSGLKLNIKDDAQDGRFSVNLNENNIEIRTSVLPGAYSESIVLRVLNPEKIAVPLEELGIDLKLLKILEEEVTRPNGMILTTGPTGSGKTTTLYAFLKKIHTPGIKIITIEDPIEYHLPGIVQTQTDDEKGYSFLHGLRSALRQDPDVIMVGEIRDRDTAEIAINAALTGHLVFSTLHTNNAAGSFPRLIDLGVNSKIISSALNIAIAQRLLRRLCEHCKKEIAVEGKTREIMEQILNSIVDKSYMTEIKNIWVAGSCEKCNNTGYRGRIGIYEGVKMDDKIESVVISNPSETEIMEAAKLQAILTMKQDGVLKILKGVTSFDELKRVIDLN